MTNIEHSVNRTEEADKAKKWDKVLSKITNSLVISTGMSWIDAQKVAEKDLLD